MVKTFGGLWPVVWLFSCADATTAIPRNKHNPIRTPLSFFIDGADLLGCAADKLKGTDLCIREEPGRGAEAECIAAGGTLAKALDEVKRTAAKNRRSGFGNFYELANDGTGIREN